VLVLVLALGVTGVLAGSLSQEGQSDLGVQPNNEGQVDQEVESGQGDGNSSPGASSGAKFTDIAGHWAQEAIESLVETGIVNGYPDGTFRPNKPVTRAEFLKMAMEAFSIQEETSTSPSFVDVKEDDWYFGYVEGAVKASLIDTDTTFRPNQSITRQEAAKILVIAMGKKDEALSRATEEQEEILSAFVDSNAISSWAKPYLAQAITDGIFNGFPDRTLKPHWPMKRAEAVTIISRALALL
jgi:hypothetical protein